MNAPPDFIFKDPQPYDHQRECFLRSRDEPAWALLMEMGTAKSRIILDTAAWLWLRGKVQLLIVVAPNDVHRTWIDKQCRDHLPQWTNPLQLTWTSDLEKTKKGTAALHKVVWDTAHAGLRVLAMNVEAFGQNAKLCRARKLVESLCNTRPTMLVVDESDDIKTPSANCTKNLVYLGKRAAYRRILTGTVVTKSPFEIYSQFEFLGEQHLGFSNYYTFTHYYGEFEQKTQWANKKLNAATHSKRKETYEVVKGYKNLPHLLANIDRISTHKLKRECLDLPPKVYMPRRYVNMTKEQADLYELIRKKTLLEFEDDTTMSLPNKLVKMMRLQQVLGGSYTNDDGATVQIFARHRDNPRVMALLDMVDKTAGAPGIIWARFRTELQAISSSLRAIYGDDSVVEFHGDVNSNDRALALQRFQAEAGVTPARFFVANTETGARGITLTRAEWMAYYSNTFSLRDRLQSEDRGHRAGLTHPISYFDFTCPGTVDSRIVEVLLANFEIASMFNHDTARAWLAPAPAQAIA